MIDKNLTTGMFTVIILITTFIITYNIYSDSRKEILYRKCLETQLEIVKSSDNRYYSLPTCYYR